MIQRLREEIEDTVDVYLEDRPHLSWPERHEALKAYRAGAIEFVIRALERAADTASRYGSESGYVNTQVDGGRIAALIRKLADELRSEKP